MQRCSNNAATTRAEETARVVLTMGRTHRGWVHSATHGGDAESCSTCIHLATAQPPSGTPTMVTRTSTRPPEELDEEEP